MTNNHLYWTVTTILQEQSGTRRAEIIKHMIKIASVSSCLLSYCHILCVITAKYMGLLLPSLEYLKDLRNFNTMFAILRYVLVYMRISVIEVCVYCVCVCTYIYIYVYACDFLFPQWIKSFVSTKIKTNMEKGSWKVSQDKKGA